MPIRGQRQVKAYRGALRQRLQNCNHYMKVILDASARWTAAHPGQFLPFEQGQDVFDFVACRAKIVLMLQKKVGV